MGLGEALGGNHLVDSGLAFAFAKDTPRTTLCATELGEAEAAAFAGAVARSFWIEWVIDDLPVWGMVGESDEEGGAEAVYTHRTYTLGYNGPFLVSVNVTSSSPAALDVGAVLSFSYAVVWVEEPGRSFERRFEAYLESSNLETKIHWMAVANSFLMVLFLTGLLALVLLRTSARRRLRGGGEGGANWSVATPTD